MMSFIFCTSYVMQHLSPPPSPHFWYFPVGDVITVYWVYPWLYKASSEGTILLCSVLHSFWRANICCIIIISCSSLYNLLIYASLYFEWFVNNKLEYFKCQNNYANYVIVTGKYNGSAVCSWWPKSKGTYIKAVIATLAAQVCAAKKKFFLIKQNCFYCSIMSIL